MLALGSGRTNILAIAQWAQDERSYLLNRLKLRNRYGEAKLPAQATFYRFFWSLSEQLGALQEALLAWAREQSFWRLGTSRGRSGLLTDPSRSRPPQRRGDDRRGSSIRVS